VDEVEQVLLFDQKCKLLVSRAQFVHNPLALVIHKQLFCNNFSFDVQKQHSNASIWIFLKGLECCELVRIEALQYWSLLIDGCVTANLLANTKT
jgi:hypothetical protein